ncbi:hypothetical protein CYMTET_15549 [Cymbomonas tetramitiformis]|uniref:Uncharacterized protein n=1 Tax=Cymbomonas tetramitiformis TaxID=36881 RepID=A0AAE0GDT4_9CHLO|nr:hypothetical protein CYMTET_15549 [Cymbomonas tetramitiformis]
MTSRLQPIVFRGASTSGVLVDRLPRRPRNRGLHNSNQCFSSEQEPAEETAKEKLSKVQDSLESAFVRGDTEQVKTLLPKLYVLGGTADGLDILARCKGIQLHRTTLLHCCCEQGSVSILDWMLSFAPNTNVDTLDGAGHTPLHRACEEGHAGICEVLLQSGADVSARTPASLLTPLHLTSMQTNAGLPPFGKCYLRVAQTVRPCYSLPDRHLRMERVAVSRFVRMISSARAGLGALLANIPHMRMRLIARS